MNLAAVDPQAHQFVVLKQRFDDVPGQQAIARQRCQAFDQARYVDHQFGQSIDLALEARVLQRRR